MHSRTTQWRRVNEMEEAVPDGTPDIVKRQMLERLHKRLLPNEPSARLQREVFLQHYVTTQNGGGTFSSRAMVLIQSFVNELTHALPGKGMHDGAGAWLKSAVARACLAGVGISSVLDFQVLACGSGSPGG